MGNRARIFVLFAVILIAMCSDVMHDFLWGPDEPRDTEIAREVFTGNYWIVSRLCGFPFLEKPPLYYDLTALSFKVSGSISQSAARSVLCLFGLLMLCSVFLFEYQWGGTKTGHYLRAPSSGNVPVLQVQSLDTP